MDHHHHIHELQTFKNDPVILWATWYTDKLLLSTVLEIIYTVSQKKTTQMLQAISSTHINRF